MNYAALWHRSGTSKQLIISYLQKYDRLLKWKNCKEAVLEIGCADGSVTKDILLPHIKDHVKKIVAVDKLAGMIEYAKETSSSEYIDYQVMDAANPEEVERRKNHFDHIFSFFVAHWIPDNRAFLSGLHKMLRSQGQIFVTIVVDTQMHKAFIKQAAEGKWLKYVPDEPILVDYTEDPPTYFANLINDVGFKVEFCETERWTIFVEQFPDFIRALLHFNRFLDRIPLHLQETYFQDHVRYCYEQGGHLRGSNDYNLSVTTMICIASK